MSIRDVLIKSRALGYSKTAIISEMKGNPHEIDVYGPEGDIILNLHITVSNPKNSGRIEKNKLVLKWELGKKKEELKKKIISLLEIPEYKKESDNLHKSTPTINSFSNIIRIKKGEKGSRAVVEFYNQQSQLTGSKIYIHNLKCGSDDS